MNQREAIIYKYISTPAGRAALAASMIQPLRTGLDYKNNETSVEILVCVIKEEKDMRKYIFNYVKNHNKVDNFRAAIKQVCPENEKVLDNFLVLK